METQKFVNLLNDSSDFPSKFATKKWYIMDSESKGNYAKENPIQFITNSIESSLCDYSDAFILVTGDITVRRGNAKLCTEINDVFVDKADYIYIAMYMYKLIEYNHNYSDTSGFLWQFKRDEIENNANVNTADSSSFKYKSDLIGNLAANGRVNNVKITVPLKYLSNVRRSLETPFGLTVKLKFY